MKWMIASLPDPYRSILFLSSSCTSSCLGTRASRKKQHQERWHEHQNKKDTSDSTDGPPEAAETDEQADDVDMQEVADTEEDPTTTAAGAPSQGANDEDALPDNEEGQVPKDMQRRRELK